MRGFLKSDFKYYLLAFTPVLVVFILIPFELYFNSRQYWNWDRIVPLSFALCGLAIYLIFSHIITLSLKIHRPLAVGLATVLFCLGLFLLLADVFSPLQASLLDGTEVTSKEPVKYSILEAFFFLALAVGAWLMRPRRLIPLAVWLVLMLILISLVYLGLIAASTRPVPGSAGPPARTGVIRGNVYHILLDEMQSDIALIYFEDEVARRRFPGFTFFQFNISNYLFTHASFPSFLTGSLWEEGSFHDWEGCYKERGLLKDLYNKGYRITMYGLPTDWNCSYVSEFKSLDDIYREETWDSAAPYRDFTQIWLARIMPNFLTRETLSLGKRLGERVYNLVRSQEAKKEFTRIRGLDGTYFPASTAEGREPFSSVLMLKQLIETEKKRAPAGEYVYAHAVIPHGAYVFDCQCKFADKLRVRGTYGYANQAKCAFNLVVKFLKELKRLGRYDRSTIIIHADTGHGHRGFIKKVDSKFVGTVDSKEGLAAGPFPDEEFAWRKSQVVARVMAMLMIKPPGCSEGFTYSKKASQLIDLYPTLVDLLGLEAGVEESPGVSLFRKEFPADREASFFFWPPYGSPAKKIKITLSDPRNPPDSPLTVSGWRGEHPDFEGVVFQETD